MTPEEIHKYKDKDHKWLISKAQEVFNRWIRNRDADGDYFACISCGKTKRTDRGDYNAGHFYSVKQYGALRFNPDNVHGECVSCNHFGKDDHLVPYRENLINKIGRARYENLVFAAARAKRKPKKWHRFELIEIIEKYKN